MTGKWKNINFPEEMLDNIKEFIDLPVVKKNLGFGTPAELIRTAVRDYLFKLNEKFQIKPIKKDSILLVEKQDRTLS